MLGSSSHTNLIVSIMSMPLSCLSAPLPIWRGHENVTTSEEPAGERNTKSLTCGVAILMTDGGEEGGGAREREGEKRRL